MRKSHSHTHTHTHTRTIVHLHAEDAGGGDDVEAACFLRVVELSLI